MSEGFEQAPARCNSLKKRVARGNGGRCTSGAGLSVDKLWRQAGPEVPSDDDGGSGPVG